MDNKILYIPSNNQVILGLDPDRILQQLLQQAGKNRNDRGTEYPSVDLTVIIGSYF